MSADKAEIVQMVTDTLSELRIACEAKQIPMLCVFLPTFEAKSPNTAEEHEPEEYCWDATCEDSKNLPDEIRSLYSDFKKNLSGCARSANLSFGADNFTDNEFDYEQKRISSSSKIRAVENICKKYKIPLFVAMYDKKKMQYGYVSPMSCNGCELKNDRFARMLGTILIHNASHECESHHKTYNH